ncbi:hypothetical protein Prudu_000740, partial [Prunus dulcis]
ARRTRRIVNRSPGYSGIANPGSRVGRSGSASEVQPTSRRNLQRVVEVHRIHHRATHSLRASKSGGKFWDWSKYKGNSAEFSAEV